MKDKMKFNSTPASFGEPSGFEGSGRARYLIELGYLSNDEDEKLLISRRMARGDSRISGGGHERIYVRAFRLKFRYSHSTSALRFKHPCIN